MEKLLARETRTESSDFVLRRTTRPSIFPLRPHSLSQANTHRDIHRLGLNHLNLSCYRFSISRLFANNVRDLSFSERSKRSEKNERNFQSDRYRPSSLNRKLRTRFFLFLFSRQYSGENFSSLRSLAASFRAIYPLPRKT